MAALAVVITAIAVAIVLGLAKKANPVVNSGPLAMARIAQPGADSAACKSLMSRLPARLAGSVRRTIAGSVPGVAAWGDPPIVLRCGLETPEELTCSSALTQVNGVSWLQLTAAGLGESTYLAADRSVRIAITVSDSAGTGPIQQISDVVSAALPVRPPCIDGVLAPTETR